MIFCRKKIFLLKKLQVNIGKNVCMYMFLFYRKLKVILDVQDIFNYFDVIVSVIEYLNCL